MQNSVGTSQQLYKPCVTGIKIHFLLWIQAIREHLFCNTPTETIFWKIILFILPIFHPQCNHTEIYQEAQEQPGINTTLVLLSREANCATCCFLIKNNIPLTHKIVYHQLREKKDLTQHHFVLKYPTLT